MNKLKIYSFLLSLVLTISCSSNPPSEPVGESYSTGSLQINCIFPEENHAKIAEPGKSTEYAYVYIYFADDQYLGKQELVMLDRNAITTIKLKSGMTILCKVMGFDERLFITYQGKSSPVRIIEDQTTTVDIIMKKIGIATIPGGSFDMGSDDGNSDEQPVHTITVDTFRMSVTEITKFQWKAILPNVVLEKEDEEEEPPELEEGEIFIPEQFRHDDSLPAQNPSWLQAVAFCNRLSELSNLEPCYDYETWECDLSKNGYRLPTEAEWEYACRAGLTTPEIEAANNNIDTMGWYDLNSKDQAHPVAEKEPNPWGLYDIYGNVAEFCNDGYDKSFYGKSPELNPLAPEVPLKQYVIRGGSYVSDQFSCRATSRASTGKSSQKLTLGFRVVCR
ncbi:MAG: formylglycine-generating enzyme family protein [Candidatus Latescibacteria bacterium]|nr:formylglycine-generating enzyme family protein [Candidatus Latescibacterota bacterium]